MSNDSDMHLKQQLVEATDAVRKKFNTIKRNLSEDQSVLQKFYEPIRSPLETLVQTVKKRRTTSPQKISSTNQLLDSKPMQEETQEVPSQFPFINTPPHSPYMESDALTNLEKFIEAHLYNVKIAHRDYDTLYGVRYDKNKDTFHIGACRVEFRDGNINLFINNKKISGFKLSHELCNMIFLKNPTQVLSNSDNEIFRTILKSTNAAYKNYDIRGGLNVTDSRKSGIVANIISPSRLRPKQGGGINLKTKVYNRKRNVEYVYWNNVKELIDRLKLLWASKMVGHTGHENEISSIIEELREEGIIY